MSHLLNGFAVIGVEGEETFEVVIAQQSIGMHSPDQDEHDGFAFISSNYQDVGEMSDGCATNVADEAQN